VAGASRAVATIGEDDVVDHCAPTPLWRGSRLCRNPSRSGSRDCVTGLSDWHHRGLVRLAAANANASAFSLA